MQNLQFFPRYTRLGVLLAALCTSLAAHGSGGHAHEHQHGSDAAHASLADIGKAGQPEQVRRTVRITMLDTMRFRPASIRVRAGETVRLVIHNAGKVKHELVLGTEQDLREHNAFMKKNPEMEHEDDNMVTVQAGQQSDIVWQFGKAGTVHFACLQPGHYEAGMKGVLTVKGRAGAGAHEGHAH